MSPCPSEVSDNALGPLYGCRQTKRSEEVLGTAPVLVGHLFIGVNCAAQGLQSRNGCSSARPAHLVGVRVMLAGEAIGRILVWGLA